MKLYRALILFFSLFHSPLFADTFSDDKEMKEIAKNALNPKYDGDLFIPVNPHTDSALKEAKEFVASLDMPHSPMKPRSNISPSPRIVFASWSMGEKLLNSLFEVASIDQNITIVFRGLQNPADITGSLRGLQNIAAKYSPVPKVIVDPVLFRKHDVKIVPTILVFDNSLTNEVSRVTGLIDPHWLDQEVSSGESGDRGVKGPSYDIAERDLSDVMREKVASVDWGKKKSQAIARYWEKQKFITLERATEHNIYYLDPSVHVTSDIKDSTGGIIVKRGSVINPLKLMPFTQALVVFDPLDRERLPVVLNRFNQLKKTHNRVTLIATQMDTVDGWAKYKSLSDLFQEHIFKLTPDVYSRFQLKRTPSIITANSQQFIIEEFVQ